MSPITDEPERIKLDNKIAFCCPCGVVVELAAAAAVVVFFDLSLAPLWSSGIWTSISMRNNAFPVNATANINTAKRMYFFIPILSMRYAGSKFLSLLSLLACSAVKNVAVPAKRLHFALIVYRTYYRDI